MPRRRSQRYHQRQSSDDEFETPALQIAAQPAQQPPLPVARPDSDDDLLSESGLGESPEEDLIEDQPSDDNDNDNNNADSDNDNDDDDIRSGLRPANDSDSDSAPEDVSFAKTREAETKRQDLIKGVLTQRKAEEREKRRKRDELFKLQKKEKVAALKKRRLPEDVLEMLSQTAEKKQKTDTKEDKDAPSAEEDFDIEQEEEEDFDSEEEDFIPLGDESKEQVTVVSLKGPKGQGRGTPFGQSVADFKRDMLYGARHKRLTTLEMRQQKAKSQARRC